MEVIKLLLVDDLEENLLALEAVLRREGIELLRAPSGSVALELLLKNDFALAIIDVHMPDMSGFELAEIMRGTERTRRIPIIFLTAGVPDLNRQFRGYESGAVDFLYKPFDPQILVSKVNVFIELARQRQEIASQRDAIHNNEERLRIALATAELSLWNWDLAADEICWPEATSTGNVSSRSCAMPASEFLKLIHPNDIQHVNETLEHSLRFPDPLRVKFRLMRSDGTARWYLWMANLDRSSNGKPLRWMGVQRDITAEWTALKDLEQAKLSAEAANAAKDRFLAVLSHELRNPLAPIRMLTTLWEMEKKLPDEYRDGLEMIRRNVDLECRLIDDMLDINRIAQGKLELRYETIDVADLIRNVIQIVEPDYQRKQLNFQFHNLAKSTLVKADAARIQQVLWNLLNNAVKFTSKGGSIELTASNPQPDILRVAVRDSGIGIEPDKLPVIFDAFEQGGQSITRKFGGLGLGLAISKAIAELHHGTLSVTSDGPQRGATFTLDLAAHVEHAVQINLDQEPDSKAASSSARRLHILLVEDQRAFAKLTEKLLQKIGHTVTVAGSIAEACHWWQAEHFDLIISDFGLPDGDGCQLLSHIECQGDVPAIALTGFGMEEDIQRAINSGYQVHLTKPVSFEQLVTAIRSLQ